jgi:hypothetical protein
MISPDIMSGRGLSAKIAVFLGGSATILFTMSASADAETVFIGLQTVCGPESAIASLATACIQKSKIDLQNSQSVF